MPLNDELDALLRAFDDCGLSLNEENVAPAFTNPKTRANAIAWVRKYINPSTCLTKDELDFFEKEGNHINVEDAVAGRPLSDAEVEAAISSLEASTVAIQRQCEILETQKRALMELKARNSLNAIANTKEDRRKKFMRERAQLDFDLNERCQSSYERMQSSIKQMDAMTSDIPFQVERLLDKDDRLLDGLQKLLPKLSDVSGDGDNSTDLEQLCTTLTHLSVKEIRSRLDMVYRESLAEHSSYQNGTLENDLTEQQQKQRYTLRAELEELGSEIDGLVGIAVDHEYRKPLKQGFLAAQADSQLQKARWSEYTVTALMYLVARLDTIHEHVQQLHSHGSALRAVSTTLTGTLGFEHAINGTHNSAASPVAERSTARGLKPLRLVQANFSEGQDPAIQLLLQHDVRVSGTESTSRISQQLETAMVDRKERLARLSRSTEQTITDALERSTADMDRETQHLLGAVYAHSTYGTVELVNKQVQSDLNRLESETQGLGDQMRDLDLEKIARSLASKESKVLSKLAK